MKVSIIMITIDRVEIVKETLGKILNNTGYDNWELLVADNGSKDGVIDYIKSLNPAVHLLHGENKGVAYSLNRLIEKSTGDLIVHIGNDILMTDNWMRTMVDCHKAIPETGICAVHTVENKGEPETVNGKVIYQQQRVFGPKMFSTKMIEKIGYYNEAYYPYGFEDADLSVRADYAGFKNYYVDGISGTHIGHDCGEKTDYRKTKDESLKKMYKGKLFDKMVDRYKENYYVDSGIKLNLGCHKWKIPGWINVDLDENVNPDIVMDVEKIDYPDNYVDEIYAGHMLEHLTVNSKALEEWKRVLKPGGKITITVPDTEKSFDLYNKGELTYEFLIQVVFGTPEVTEHHMVFSKKSLIERVGKVFPNVTLIDNFEHLVAEVNWQTICQATK